MDNTKWYKLEPIDAWFFRDGRPSNRDEDQSDLESLFPPHASTVVGAIRAALARQQGWDGSRDWDFSIKKILGDGFENLGTLTFTGPFLMKSNEFLFPVPRHLLGLVKENTFTPCTFLKPSDEPILCDLGEVRLPVPQKQNAANQKPFKQADGFFITSLGMQKILNGKLPTQGECIHQDILFQLEGRVGVERDQDSRTTLEGGLYSPKYVRLKKDVSLVMGINGLPDGWELPPLFPLGGESRLAGSTLLDNPPTVPHATDSDGNTLIILVTPAHFDCQEQGKWFGAGPDEDASSLHFDFTGKIKTACFDRPLRIGGWDSLKRQPLPMQPYLSSGAIWWLEDEIKKIDNKRQMRLGDKTAYGYGMVFVGKSAN